MKANRVMKKVVIGFAAMMIGLVWFTGSAWAKGPYNRGCDRVERRQDRQEARIHNGMKNGSLTHREAERLKREQDRIDRTYERALRNGRLSPKERARLEKMQDRASERIKKARHNRNHKRHYNRHENCRECSPPYHRKPKPHGAGYVYLPHFGFQWRY